MLAPRLVIFTPSTLLGSSNSLAQPVAEALLEIERRNVPLVLSTPGTRAQLEPLRRKIAHAHPFITEGGGGLFFLDGYFALRLEGARRAARYLCVPFGRSSEQASAAAEDIAQETGAEIVRYAEMSAREIARNTGMTERDAGAAREREFTERFFFAGNADSAAEPFERIAAEHGWQFRRFGSFWELCSGNDEGKAVSYLMRLYRQTLRSRIRSVAIGARSEDLSLLAAADQALILPISGSRFDEHLLSKLPNSSKITVPGAAGWNQTVLSVLGRI